MSTPRYQPGKVYHDNWLNNGLPDKSVNLIIADPPYFEVKGNFDFIWDSFDDYLQDVETWAKECKRLLADNGTLFWWGHAKRIAYAQIIFDKYLNIENSLIWKKKDCQTLKNEPTAMRTYAPVTERLLMYSNEVEGQNVAENNYSFQIGKKFCEIMDPLVSYLMDEMIAAGHTVQSVNKELKTAMASHWFTRTSQWGLPTRKQYERLRELFNNQHLQKDYNFLRVQYEELRVQYEELRVQYEELRRPFIQTKLQTDVLEYSQEAHLTQQYEHETKKPETLTRKLILTNSRPGDLVFIPFAGSGTECAMAAKDGRNFIGFDIEKKYVDMANNRINTILIQPQLL